MGNIEHGSLAYAEGHEIHFAEYANATAREGASGLTSADDLKIALQTDDNSLWILTDYSGPTWVHVGLAQADSIDGSKIADDAIDSEHYVDGSIDLAHMSANSIDSDQYVDGSIDKAHLSGDCVDGTKIEDDAIDSEHYTDASIDKAHLSADSVDGTKIEDDAIDSEHYADGSIDAAHLATNAVETAKIKDANVTAAKFAKGAVGMWIPGFNARAKFDWKDADEIYVGAGCYHHHGTTEQMVYWDSKLTFAFQNLGASDISYLYLDDSAIVTAGTNLISATELIDSVTEPAYNQAKHGWYNGEDKVLFGARTNGSSQILEFFHDGGDHVQFAANIQCRALANLGTTWEDVTMIAPIFSTKVLGWFRSVLNGGETANLFCRVNGQTDTTGFNVGHSTGDANISTVISPAFTDAAQIIEVKHDVANVNQCGVYTLGWYFPAGV